MIFFIAAPPAPNQVLKNKASDRQPRHYQLKAQGSRLTGKDAIRSPFSFQLQAFNSQM
jgi:hypothetical protein